MGKLVLGIIAVTLLQVAFFVYVAKDGADHMTVGEIAARSEPRIPELNRVNEVPQVVVPTNPLPLPVAGSERVRVRTPLATGNSVRGPKTRPSVESRDRAVRKQATIPSDDYASSRKFPSERIVVPKRSGASIPRGYTMVLVDYPTVASTKQAKEISKPRKRSYLARALPALVKKPWNWIKSIASKLD